MTGGRQWAEGLEAAVCVLPPVRVLVLEAVDILEETVCPSRKLSAKTVSANPSSSASIGLVETRWRLALSPPVPRRRGDAGGLMSMASKAASIPSSYRDGRNRHRPVAWGRLFHFLLWSASPSSYRCPAVLLRTSRGMGTWLPARSRPLKWSIPSMAPSDISGRRVSSIAWFRSVEP